MLQVDLPTIDRIVVLVDRCRHAEVGEGIAGLSSDSAICGINAWGSCLVLQNPVIQLTTGRGRSESSTRLVSVGAITRVRKVEQGLVELCKTNEVGDVLVEISDREIASIGVVPLERQVEVIGLMKQKKPFFVETK